MNRFTATTPSNSVISTRDGNRNSNRESQSRRSKSLDDTFNTRGSHNSRDSTASQARYRRQNNMDLSQLKPDLMPLAHPKGQHVYCDVCGSPAYYSCKVCKNVFFCGIKHMSLDMEIMHPAVCHLIAQLRGPLSHSNIKAEREKFKAERMILLQKVIQISFYKARRSLQRRKAKEALLQVTYSLRFAKKLYKPDDPAVIPLFLLCAEAYGMDNRLEDAEQYLAKTEFIMSKSGNCPETIKADFYKTKGVIDMYGKKYTEARQSFSEEIFCATEAYHTDHRRTAQGYFNLGTVFLKLKRSRNVSHSLFMHAIEIMCTALFDELQLIINLEAQGGLLVCTGQESIKGSITEEELIEIRVQLTFMYKNIVNGNDNTRSIDVIKSCYVLSLFYYITGEYRMGLEYVDRGNAILADLEKLGSVGGSIISTTPRVSFERSKQPDNPNRTPQVSPMNGWSEKLKFVKKHLQRQFARGGGLTIV